MSIVTYTNNPPVPKTKVDATVFKMVHKMLATSAINYETEFYIPLGISKQYYSHIRTGKRSFTVAHLQAICKLYQVDANLLLGLKKGGILPGLKFSK